jgi:hypothetical protein
VAVAAATLVALHPGANAQSFRYAFGDRFAAGERVAPPLAPLSADALHRWNRIAVDASGLDHTPVAPGEDRVFGEQLGPGRSSRAIAIVHIAMADVVSAITNSFDSYTNVTANPGAISQEIAISRVARDTLAALFPSQAQAFNSAHEADLLMTNEPAAAVANGVDLGQRVATAILAMRANDGAATPEPVVGTGHVTSPLAGHWRQDPVSLIPLALGAYWGQCLPFIIQSVAAYRTPPPPAMTSPEYTLAYNEVKSLGGDGITTPTQRTAEQTFIGIFWAYDGTPSLCAPPRLYNQIAVQIGDQRGLNTPNLARLLALVNMALADTGFAAWDSKYHWDVWRPITGIRESDVGTGPTGSGDGNPDTIGDPGFMPLGAPASNLVGPNFTPPFPAYPSGHAAFGGALFQTLRRFFQADQIPFTFVSDEFNGVTRDNAGNVRPYMPRSFGTLSAAEQENGLSRIYLGIHWIFDSTEGIAQGRQIADYVFGHAFEVTAPIPIAAVSRKTHGAAGPFDVDLPLSGSPGIDPRSGGADGNHQVIVTFAHAIESSSASITSGSGNIASYTVAGAQATVNLTGVVDGETLVIRLNAVNDGAVTGPVDVRLMALLGDTNGNGIVNASDVSETKAQAGQPATNMSFRTDVTVNGITNTSDVGVVKAQSGSAPSSSKAPR